MKAAKLLRYSVCLPSHRRSRKDDLAVCMRVRLRKVRFSEKINRSISLGSCDGTVIENWTLALVESLNRRIPRVCHNRARRDETRRAVLFWSSVADIRRTG